MINLICGLVLVIGLIALMSILVVALLITIKRLTDTNKQLLILLVGKEAKPEALRALITSNKPPQKNLSGIAVKKKNADKLKNVDYEMSIGVG